MILIAVERSIAIRELAARSAAKGTTQVDCYDPGEFLSDLANHPATCIASVSDAVAKSP